MYPRTCFRAFQCALPGLWVKWASRLTGKDKSGHVATCNHIKEPRASQYGISFISSTSVGVDGQSSTDSDML